MGAFLTQVSAGVAEMQADLQDGVRRFYLELFTMIIQRSPVGNPVNWKVNKNQKTATDFAAAQNSLRRRMSSTSYVRKTKAGGSVRVLRKGARATGESVLPTRWGRNTSAVGPRRHIVRRGGDMFRSPKGYTGGRFRANWQFSLEAPAQELIDAIDPSGSQALAALRQVLGNLDITTSKTAYFVNNLEYATAIEFGVPGKSPLYPVWSKQAPQGVVRISLVEAQQIWNEVFGS